MNHRRFKALNIISAIKPGNAHLMVETNSAGTLYIAGGGASIYKTIDKGDNYSTVVTHANYVIYGLFHDRTNSKLYFVEMSALFQLAKVYYIDLTDDSITQVGGNINPGDGLSQPEEGDVWVDGVNVYCIIQYFDSTPARDIRVYKSAAGGGFVNTASIVPPSTNMGYVTIVGTDAYFIEGTSSTNMTLRKYNMTNDTLDLAHVIEVTGFNLFFHNSIAYDGNNVLQFVLNKNADGKDYLYIYDILGGTDTQLAQMSVSLMLDRNNSGIAPNELEKAFSTDSVETVYEIKARRGGIRILQDCSVLSDAVLISITDNFLMNNDGDMFEFTDVTNEISTIRYNDGIIGIQKKGVFTVHPDFHANWSKKDSIKIYDDNDVLEFHGIITDKNRNSRGIYVFKIDSFTNEIYRATYEKNYSGDDTDTKQKDIIDNGCDFCYRSSSIVGTTTNYDYAYNRAIAYLFWLARFLERQVPYIEPDGKIWTKAYNGLVATGKSWDIDDNSQEVFLVDIPGIDERIQGFFDGNSGVTRNTIRYKNNASTIRPVAATRDPIEQLQGILPLNEFRDPKLAAATEANQLGDNRYDIWSSDIIFLGLRIQGQGYLPPGKTIEIQNTGEITITQDDFLILSFERDPKNDVYISMVLSDNIIFPREFNNLQDTTITQVHTASVQSIENQAGIDSIAQFVWRTPEETVEYDFIKTTLTDNTNWNDLDLSGIIPEGSIAAYIFFVIADNATNSFLQLRKNGQTGGFQTHTLRTQVANIPNDNSFIVGVDGDRKCEISINPKPTDWTVVNVIVLGWFV